MKDLHPGLRQSGNVVESYFLSSLLWSLCPMKRLCRLTAAAAAVTRTHLHHQTSQQLELEKTTENIKSNPFI